jgi:hypothetical protein
VLWSRNDLLRFRFRLWKSFDFQFFNNKKSVQNLAFSCQKQHYFPANWPVIFDLLTFLFHLILNPDPYPTPEQEHVPVPVPLKQKVTAPAVPVPQHCH